MSQDPAWLAPRAAKPGLRRPDGLIKLAQVVPEFVGGTDQ